MYRGDLIFAPYIASILKHVKLTQLINSGGGLYQVEAGTQLPHTIEVGNQLFPPN